jgi:hypothetical protein
MSLQYLRIKLIPFAEERGNGRREGRKRVVYAIITMELRLAARNERSGDGRPVPCFEVLCHVNGTGMGFRVLTRRLRLLVFIRRVEKLGGSSRPEHLHT